MNQKLTTRQRAVLEFIVDYIERHRFPPTMREIGDHLGIASTNGVSDHIKALTRKGCLYQRTGKRSRTLLPTPLGLELLGRGTEERDDPAQGLGRGAREGGRVVVPLVGRVAAGQPILAQEHLEDQLVLDSSLLPAQEGIFALRVQGDSMVGDGILHGDLVFVRKQSTAREGAIVVAMIDGEATVKRYYHEGERVRFQPSNPTMDPIYVHRKDFKRASILGEVVGVYRRVH